ncbi:hypothetical protein ABPG72_004681 [Tetrahymena utriculariae]
MDNQYQQENRCRKQIFSQQNKNSSSQEIEDYFEDISRASDSEENHHHIIKKQQKQNLGSRFKSIDYLKKYEDDIIYLKRSLSCRFQKENKYANVEWIKQQIDKVNKTQQLEPRFEILSKIFDQEDQIFEYLHQSSKKLFIQFFVHIDNNLQNSQQLYQKLKDSLTKSKDRKKEDEHNVISHFKILFEKYHYDYQEFKNVFRKQFPDLYQSARKESNFINNKTEIKMIKNKSNNSASLSRQSFNQYNYHQDATGAQKNNIFSKQSKERKISYQIQPQKKQKKFNQEFDTSFSTNKSNQQDDFIDQNSYFDEICKVIQNSENHSPQVNISNERNNNISEQGCQDSKNNQEYEDQRNQVYGSILECQINQTDQRSQNLDNDQYNQENQYELQNKIQQKNVESTYQIQQLNNQNEQFTQIDQETNNQNIINNQFSNSSLTRILRNVPLIENQTELEIAKNVYQNEQNLQIEDFQMCQCLQFRQEQIKQLESNLFFLQKARKALSEQLSQLKISLENNYMKFQSQQNHQQTLNSLALQYDDLIFQSQRSIIKKQNQKNMNQFYSQNNLLNNQ